MSSHPLVWLITGCCTGIDRELITAALKRADKVTATPRAVSFLKIQDLTSLGADILSLDVTESMDELRQFAARAVAIYGRIDVVVNNAGFVLTGSLEETTYVIIDMNWTSGLPIRHEETLTQFNVNVFGALNVSRAFLPYMRPRRSGTIAFIRSCLGWYRRSFAGLYAATKFALRGISETLHQEIAPFGMQSLCFDFGFCRTPILNKIEKRRVYLPDYREAAEAHDVILRSLDGRQPGDPVRGASAVVDITKGEGLAAGKKMPQNGIALGADTYEVVKKSCEDVLERLAEWKKVTLSTDFLDPESSAE